MITNLNKYWKERYEAEEQRRAKSDEELERQLDAIYEQHIAEIQKEIDAFWQRYADKNGITKLEAKRQADKLDMDVVSYKAKQLVARAEKMRQNGHKVTQKDFTKAENDLMKLYNLKMKTSRLEVLQANLKLHQYELTMNELEATERHLIEAVRQENLYSSGILRETLGSYQTAKTSAETIVYANFHGSNWSSNIWDRQDALRSVVKKGVADTVLRGKGTQLLIKQLEKEFKVSNGYARRLAVTETARVYSEAQKANYKANGFEEYEVLAESGACGICRPENGKHYKVADMVPSHNAPPFHPNCRCTTVPYLEREKSVDKAKEKSYNQGMEDVKSSGGISARRGDIKKQQDEFAERYYNQLRNSKRGDVVSKISDRSGVDKETVSTALQHILDNEYMLWDSEEFEYRMRTFYPHYDMALSLQRLMIDKILDNDITMLKHEALEHHYMNVLKMAYDDAHKLANLKYNYEEGDDNG